ncbi:hypothetical protein Tco_1494032 [Tanacetum coccineum]
MLNKDNYVSWSSCLLHYEKSKPNGKLLVNSIKNGPYVRRIIHEPGNPNSVPSVDESTHEQINDELTEKEVKQMEVDDQAIQTIRMGLSEDIYAAEKKAELFNECERFTSTEGESIELYYHHFLKLMNDFSRNKHFLEKMASNLKFLSQDRQMQMVRGNGGNQFRQYAGQNVRNQNGYNVVQNVGNQVVQNAVQNPSAQNVGNQNRLIVIPRIAYPNVNQHGNGLGHLYRNCTIRPSRKDVAYLQTQLLIAQKEEAGIQLQAEEFDLIAAARDLDEIEEVNANRILMANLQQASTSGTQTNKALVYDSDGSSEVHEYDNCYNNEIFNMFTQEEQYTELLKPIPEPQQVQ